MCSSLYYVGISAFSLVLADIFLSVKTTFFLLFTFGMLDSCLFVAGIQVGPGLYYSGFFDESAIV
jgi:hypothetical protein